MSESITLQSRNDTDLMVSFGVVTVAASYLSGAYLSEHHEALDALTTRLDGIRTDALKASQSWEGIDLAGVVVKLLASIAKVKPTKADKASKTKAVTAIDNLRASDVVTSAMDECQPLLDVMLAKGTANLLAALSREQTHHTVQGRMWEMAAHIELHGDVGKYIDDEAVTWPRIRGSARERTDAVATRAQILTDVLSRRDGVRVYKALRAHLTRAEELDEKEEGN